jgi:hypothetical protein
VAGIAPNAPVLTKILERTLPARGNGQSGGRKKAKASLGVANHLTIRIIASGISPLLGISLYLPHLG